MSDRAAFLRTICDHPDDDAPRLVFADWLQDTGDPADAARAEFIRLQVGMLELRCVIDSREEGDGLCPYEHCPWCSAARREQELMTAGFNYGWNDFPACFVEWWFRRGFVERVKMAWRDWLAHADALRRATPLREVELTDNPGEFEQLSVGGVFADSGNDTLWRIAGLTFTAPTDATTAELLAKRWPGITFTLPVRIVNEWRPAWQTPALANLADDFATYRDQMIAAVTAGLMLPASLLQELGCPAPEPPA